MRQFITANNLGRVFHAPLDVVLNEENVVQPDILFISQDKTTLITKQNIQGAPDLVIEIVSPTSAYYDLVKKKKLYARFSVQEYWVMDPEERTVEIFNLSGGEMRSTSRLTQPKQTVTSSVLSGFKLSLSKIFTF